jgi:hypothetical protein
MLGFEFSKVLSNVCISSDSAQKGDGMILPIVKELRYPALFQDALQENKIQAIETRELGNTHWSLQA